MKTASAFGPMISGFLQAVCYFDCALRTRLTVFRRPTKVSMARTGWRDGNVSILPTGNLSALTSHAGLFIIDGLITVPIALLGFVIMPGRSFSHNTFPRSEAAHRPAYKHAPFVLVQGARACHRSAPHGECGTTSSHGVHKDEGCDFVCVQGTSTYSRYRYSDSSKHGISIFWFLVCALLVSLDLALTRQPPTVYVLVRVYLKLAYLL
jgi:hypothetical protein